ICKLQNLAGPVGFDSPGLHHHQVPETPRGVREITEKPAIHAGSLFLARPAGRHVLFFLGACMCFVHSAVKSIKAFGEPSAPIFITNGSICFLFQLSLSFSANPASSNRISSIRISNHSGENCLTCIFPYHTQPKTDLPYFDS